MTDTTEALLRTFNSKQLSAAQTLDGPLLIAAGAGSGKTKVLTYRIGQIIKQKKALPHQILAVTFTNKAAQEMQERVQQLLTNWQIPIQSKMWISTFHSMCARILQDNLHIINPNTIFTIYDHKDQLSLVKKVMKDLNISEKMYNPKTFTSQISNSKRQGLNPEDLNKDNCPTYGSPFQKLYFQYETELKKAGAFDFDGLLFETYKAFLKYPEILQKYRQNFLYISVDEYQDTNHIQYLIIKAIATKNNNICVVGDEDQSIYSWRGADISNILNFDQDFPNCKIIKLEQNYRSTVNIISAASALISHNTSRQDKKLFTKNPTGTKIELYELEDEYKEAQLITNIIETQCQKEGFSYTDFAIFYRTNAQSRTLEDSLRSKNIPYKIVGNLKFYDRLEIKDILAYLKFIANSKDEISLKRILNTPRRGIGANTIQNITQISHLQNKSFYEVMQYLSETNQIKGPARSGIAEFIQVITALKTQIDKISLSNFYNEVLTLTGYTKVLKADDSIESLSRLENLQEFKNAIHQFELENDDNTLENFLKDISLFTPTNKADEVQGITLMTLHVSKGLEFNTVFITGLEEGLFPVSQNINDDNLEEERRLAYVGMTRAQKNLYLTYSIKRSKFGTVKYNQASQFLSEIPKKFMNIHSFIKKTYFKKATPTYNTHHNHSSYYSSYEEDNSHSNTSFTVGQIVHHPRFGAGKIQKIEGKDDDLKISVMFNNHRLKKFIAKYAHLSN